MKYPHKAHKKSRNYMRIMLMGLLIAAFFFRQLPALADENDEQTGTDSWIVILSDETAAPPGADKGAEKLIPIGHGAYLADDADYAEELLQSGLAECVEPNLPVTLFDYGANDWPCEMMRGSELADSQELDGGGVRIAIIDSGLDADNENLSGARIVQGYDYTELTTDMTDQNGHGTAIAQIIAGAGVNGVTGLARGAELVPLRCFSSKKGDISDVIMAIYDAVDKYHCDIINMSWGIASNSEALHQAVDYASDAGMILVAAAGNVGSDAPQGTLYYPAAYDTVIGVGALDREGNIASFSQNTEAVSVCAPGKSIFVKALHNAGSKTENGTSFAAPFISAEAALIRQITGAMDNKSFIALLKERSKDLGEEGYDLVYGYGLPTLSGIIELPWYRISNLAGSVTLDGWNLRAENGYSTCAIYGSNGKMAGVCLKEVEMGICSQHFSWKAPDAVQIKLFLLDEDFAPIGDAVLMEVEYEEQENSSSETNDESNSIFLVKENYDSGP